MKPYSVRTILWTIRLLLLASLAVGLLYAWSVDRSQPSYGSPCPTGWTYTQTVTAEMCVKPSDVNYHFDIAIFDYLRHTSESTDTFYGYDFLRPSQDGQPLPVSER